LPILIAIYRRATSRFNLTTGKEGTPQKDMKNRATFKAKTFFFRTS